MGAFSPSARSGLAGMLVALVLLVLPATASSAANNDVVVGVGSGFGRPEGSNEVRLVQRRLRAVGLPAGAVDGLFGPRTELAVRRFQRRSGLVVDGLAGPRTRRLLARVWRRAPLRLAVDAGVRDGRVVGLQRRLAARGFSPGRVDGRFGPSTERAVRAFQRSRRLTVDGIAGPLTQAELARPAGRSGSGAAARNAASAADAGGGRRAAVGRRVAQRRSPAAAGRPGDRSGGRSDGGLSAVGELLLGLVAALVGLVGIAGLLVVRRGRALVPVSPDAVARGHSPAAGGRFEGRVHALAVDRPLVGRRRSTHYLVSGSTRPTPAWVPLADVAALSHEPPERHAALQAPARLEQEPDEPAGPPAGVPGRQAGLRVLGYAASRDAARADDPELGRQTAAIAALCHERGWQLAGLIRDTDQTPGRGRPALAHLLDRLAAGEASCLVVTELERLCRSVAELGDILAALEHTGGRLIALQPELDTGSPAGRAAAQTLAAISAWERQRLAERTRKGLAAARARGAVSRPAVEDRPELKRRIIAMRRAGMTLQAIADELNAEGVRTVRGGARWRPSSVQAALGYKRPVRTRGNGVDDQNQEEEEDS